MLLRKEMQWTQVRSRLRSHACGPRGEGVGRLQCRRMRLMRSSVLHPDTGRGRVVTIGHRPNLVDQPAGARMSLGSFADLRFRCQAIQACQKTFLRPRNSTKIVASRPAAARSWPLRHKTGGPLSCKGQAATVRTITVISHVDRSDWPHTG